MSRNIHNCRYNPRRLADRVAAEQAACRPCSVRPTVYPALLTQSGSADLRETCVQWYHHYLRGRTPKNATGGPEPAARRPNLIPPDPRSQEATQCQNQV